MEKLDLIDNGQLTIGNALIVEIFQDLARPSAWYNSQSK